MNKDMRYTESTLRSCVGKCFKDAFKSLYNETFSIQIDNYEIICSSGVERL